MKKLKNIGNKLAPIVFIIILLVLWQCIVTIGGIEKYIMPAPTDVMQTLVKDFKVMI
ncbi:ABC transporter permease, partial [Clostridium perfringens]|nr:ABC transporter permease [Clostridium perfringens]